MKKHVIILLLFVAAYVQAQQYPPMGKDGVKLVKDAIARGKNSEGCYCVTNPKNKLVTVEQVVPYLTKEGYYTTESNNKSVSIFGQKQIVLDQVCFTDFAGYEKFAFDKFKGKKYQNISFSQLKPGGTFFYFVQVRDGLIRYHEEFRRIENVKWSGEIVDGYINGKGVGIVKIDNDWGVFEGDFFNGITTDNPVNIKMSNGGEKQFGNFGWGDDHSKWSTVLECWEESNDFQFNQAAKKYAANIYDTYKDGIQDNYNKLLTINTTKYKNYMIRKGRAVYFRFYNEYNSAYNNHYYDSRYNDPYSYVYEDDKSLLVVISTDRLRQFVREFQGKGKSVDHLNLISKAEEILELIKVADEYRVTHAGSYVGERWLTGTLYFDEVAVNNTIKNFLECLEIVEKKHNSKDASFKDFYAKVYPWYKSHESYYRNEFKQIAYDNYLKAQGKYLAEMCDKCKIDGDKTTVPTGYKPEDKGIFFSTPAQSEKEGRIQMHNGKVVYWKYIYDGKYTKIETYGDLGNKTYSSKEEMMDGVIRACKEKYCQ